MTANQQLGCPLLIDNLAGIVVHGDPWRLLQGSLTQALKLAVQPHHVCHFLRDIRDVSRETIESLDGYAGDSGLDLPAIEGSSGSPSSQTGQACRHLGQQV